MDPERIHAYLQAACAGLGFDIGEVWFSAVDRKHDNLTKAAVHRIQIGTTGDFEPSRSIKYLQLYTSRSYGDTQDLIKPESGEEEDEKNLPQKHVLSPTLVNAIATNAQVVWANCQKQEGLLGKSRMRLQTAVGMPVAMDCYGNMCIVVMFSLKSVQSTKEAMEFIKLISQGAASSKIPCLLPVVDSTQTQLDYDPQKFREWQRNEIYLQQIEAQRSMLSGMNNGTNQLEQDRYGIPILPDFAELLTTDAGTNNNSTQKRLSFLADNNETNDDFDNSTFGLWSTIMNGPTKKRSEPPLQQNNDPGFQHKINYLEPDRRVRLEEFVTAFLGFSLFDIADVWTPIYDANGVVSLHNVLTANSEQTDAFSNVQYFKNVSNNTYIKPWSGAVGRAYSTGNPVWSTNSEIVFDTERTQAFYAAKINTVVAIPINHDSAPLSCIICFYSFVRTDSSTFVIKFLQQALRTLWEGLDTVDLHESIGTEQWNGFSAADMGEMAADVELQRALYNRKRTHELIQETAAIDTPSTPEVRATKRTNRASSFFEQLQSINGEFANPSPSDGEIGQRTQRASSFFEQLQSLAGDFAATTTPTTTVGGQTGARKQRSSSLAEQLRTLNGESSPKVVDGNQVYPLLPNELSLQNFTAAAQQVPVQVVGLTNPNLFGDDMKINFSNIDTPIVQTVEDQQLPMVGKMEDPSPQLCLPAGSTKLQHQQQFPTPTLADSNIVETKKNKPKICRIEGCNDPSVSRRPYCTRHTGNRICEYAGGCKKCAQGATRFCIAHGGGRRCTFPGCDKGARDKFFCAAHGGGKRCKMEGCNKSAVGGSKLCTSHGGGRRCAVEDCVKSAQSSTKFCVKHGGGKKCAHEGCFKVARGRTNFCASHGGGVRCKLEGCNRIAIGKLQLCRAHGGGSTKSKKKGSQQDRTAVVEEQMIDQEVHRQQQQQHSMQQMEQSMLYSHNVNVNHQHGNR